MNVSKAILINALAGLRGGIPIDIPSVKDIKSEHFSFGYRIGTKRKTTRATFIRSDGVRCVRTRLENHKKHGRP